MLTPQRRNTNVKRITEDPPEHLRVVCYRIQGMETDTDKEFLFDAFRRGKQFSKHFLCVDSGTSG